MTTSTEPQPTDSPTDALSGAQNRSALSSELDGGAGMFDRIARRYDRLNRIISLGMDRAWRHALVESLAPSGSLASGDSVLDVATGTADVALRIAERYPTADVVGLDPSAGMLSVGRAKIDRAGVTKRMRLVVGDAQSMPFRDGHFAASCIAFGIRNVPDRLRGLREMTRVTRSQGMVSILELGEPHGTWLAPFARLHLRHVVPRLGSWLTGDAAYRYLSQSVADFPAPKDFAQLMQRAGLSVESITPFAAGAANLYVGRRRS
jgi:demethylmenaquinone methyltransferase/2-methoxy-6-polyprenyl-1,4-benzoquinol methylase